MSTSSAIQPSTLNAGPVKSTGHRHKTIPAKLDGGAFSYGPIHVGMIVRKRKSGRLAQVSAIAPTHAVLYWPDHELYQSSPEQTEVRLERFQRSKEWELL